LATSRAKEKTLVLKKYEGSIESFVELARAGQDSLAVFIVEQVALNRHVSSFSRPDNYRSKRGALLIRQQHMQMIEIMFLVIFCATYEF
jgi:hypothetical protein